jgi:Protein kinase domain
MSDARVGMELAGYRIESVLGRGGMSVVYLAEDLALGRKVALKVLATHLAEDERFRERFVRESRLAASLEHPNIVPIYEAREADGMLFIAMRLVRGTDLATLLERDGPLEPARAANVVSQVAEALDAAHAEGLVHRDVKAANILVAPATGSSGPDHVYLTDFGLTKRVLSMGASTKTGQFLGTIDYAAPEQFEGKELDARTDIYSLGCVLYECLTGERPFGERMEPAVMHAHMTEQPPAPTATQPTLPRAIDGVVRKAMAKRPDDRYQRAGDLAQAARAALGAPAPSGPPPPTKRPRARLLLVGAAALAVALAVVLVLLLAGHGTPAAGPSTPPRTGTTPPITLQPPAAPAGSVAAVDPKTGKVGLVVRDAVSANITPAGGEPGVAVGEGFVWAKISGARGQRLEQIDPESGQIRHSTAVGSADFGSTNELAIGFRAIWTPLSALGTLDTSLTRVNPATGARLRSFDISGHGDARDVATGAGAVWVPFQDGTLLRVSPQTGKAKAIDIGGSLDAVAVSGATVWVIDEVESAVTRLDAHGGHRRLFPVAGSLKDVVATDDGAWILDPVAGAVIPIGVAAEGPGAPIRVGEDPTGIAAGLGAIWVSDGGGAIYRIDPALGVATPIQVGVPLVAIAVDEPDRVVWVAVRPA